MTIPDLGVRTKEAMREILDMIDGEMENGRPVYVHCLGGIGRTGTVVGCWLARHGIASGEAVLDRIAELRRNDPSADVPSPETRQQRNFVRTWKAGE
jgi:protein-tyrosine phosphatase